MAGIGEKVQDLTHRIAAIRLITIDNDNNNNIIHNNNFFNNKNVNYNTHFFNASGNVNNSNFGVRTLAEDDDSDGDLCLQRETSYSHY